jgi:hypothetical protein
MDMAEKMVAHLCTDEAELSWPGSKMETSFGDPQTPHTRLRVSLLACKSFL